MRRRDKLFLGLLWGALLAGLAWALSTQSRWSREAKPIGAPPPMRPEEATPKAVAAPGTGVVGTISEDTVTAMSKGLDAKPAPKTAPKVQEKAKPAPRP